jgi:hypothetical protein
MPPTSHRNQHPSGRAPHLEMSFSARTTKPVLWGPECLALRVSRRPKSIDVIDVLWDLSDRRGTRRENSWRRPVAAARRQRPIIRSGARIKLTPSRPLPTSTNGAHIIGWLPLYTAKLDKLSDTRLLDVISPNKSNYDLKKPIPILYHFGTIFGFGGRIAVAL